MAAASVALLVAISFLTLVVADGGDADSMGTPEEDLAGGEPGLTGWRQATAGFSSAAERHEEDLAGGEAGLTGWRRAAAEFRDTAENYGASLATFMRSMTAAVVQRAQLQAGERILDVGTSTVIGTSAALSWWRAVIGVHAARNLLTISHGEVRGERFGEGDFSVLPFEDGWFDLVVSVHALQFAADPTAVLDEWRRVTRPGGRLSLSVPGPRAALAMNIYDSVYRSHGMRRRVQVPTRKKLSAWARAAGWQEVKIVADPDTVIPLAGPNSFRAWIQTRSWPDADQALSPDVFEALEEDLRAATPMGPDGQLLIPFGTLYLVARNP